MKGNCTYRLVSRAYIRVIWGFMGTMKKKHGNYRDYYISVCLRNASGDLGFRDL